MANEENRFIVKSTPAAGYQGKWRAGRRWDKGGVEVEVVDQDEDPTPGDDECLRIGKKTFRALQEDESISVSPKGLNLSNTKAMEESIAALTTELAGARKDAEALAAENDALRAQVESLSAELKTGKKK